MKKILMAGVLAASMAVSSSAFAAVEYGNADTLDLSYDAATNQVSVDMATPVDDGTTTLAAKYAGKQLTVVVLDQDDDASTIVASEIMYIDQAEASTTIFQNMGLLLKDDATTLPVGTYDVKLGGEGITTLLVGQIIVEEDGPAGVQVNFKFGDVNGNGAVDATDAGNLLALAAGGAADRGGAYTIGAVVDILVAE